MADIGINDLVRIIDQRAPKPAPRGPYRMRGIAFSMTQPSNTDAQACSNSQRHARRYHGNYEVVPEKRAGCLGVYEAMRMANGGALRNPTSCATGYAVRSAASTSRWQHAPSRSRRASRATVRLSGDCADAMFSGNVPAVDPH